LLVILLAGETVCCFHLSGDYLHLNRRAVDVRRAHLGRAITANIPVAEVVGLDEDDVGLFGR